MYKSIRNYASAVFLKWWSVLAVGALVALILILINGAASQAGAAASPIPTSEQLLENPGFESGEWTPWQIFGFPELTDLEKHSGTWSARAGGEDLADDQFVQQGTIPLTTSQATFTFWYKLQTSEIAPGSDFLYYGIWDLTGQNELVVLSIDIGDVGNQYWTGLSYTLTPDELSLVAGQTVLFGFLVQTDFSLSSQAWIDDTTVEVSFPNDTPTPTATETLTPTPTTTDTATPTPTLTPTPENTSTPTPTSTITGSPTATSTPTPPVSSDDLKLYLPAVLSNHAQG